MSTSKRRRGFSGVMTSRQGGFIVITLAFAVLLCVYPDNNLFTWIEAKREIAVQEKTMRKYQREINRMQTRIGELTSDRDTLEKFARENFHFAVEGEDVYLIGE